ncbi:MAG: hypothetical protein JWN15_4170, partial [Firmicutes bacterium]|nr:hypothetical protein [Bacillota bacterium]
VRAAAAETAAVRRRVRLIDSVLSDDDLAWLYRSADALVAPYRGEGFCLPALEAMACGTPPILPRAGAALDYATPETALLVAAAVTPAGDRVDGMALAAQGLICEVSPGALRQTMRWAYEHRSELRRTGDRGAAHVHAHFTWEHAARAANARLKQLLGSEKGAVH